MEIFGFVLEAQEGAMTGRGASLNIDVPSAAV
jgi:hypothetical protein